MLVAAPRVDLVAHHANQCNCQHAKHHAFPPFVVEACIPCSPSKMHDLAVKVFKNLGRGGLEGFQ